MGNHTIDCVHCGEDQRLGFPCCDAAKKDEENRTLRIREAERVRHLLEYIFKKDPGFVSLSRGVATGMWKLEYVDPGRPHLKDHEKIVEVSDDSLLLVLEKVYAVLYPPQPVYEY